MTNNPTNTLTWLFPKSSVDKYLNGWILDCTWVYWRTLLKTDVLVPNRPTPSVSSIILLLLLITPSVRWLGLRAWMATPKLSVIPWKMKKQKQKTTSLLETQNKHTKQVTKILQNELVRKNSDTLRNIVGEQQNLRVIKCLSSRFF